ncbi:MAG: hypothetical protein ABIK64_00735 [Bacillota bacterium]
MRKQMKIVTLIMALIVMLTAFGIPTAAAESQTQILNILFLVCEGTGKAFTPMMPMIVTLDFEKTSIRVISFYYQTQIDAVTKKGKALSMPMNFLSYCDLPEIVKAYENTFGIPIDRYLVYQYRYGSYEPVVGVFDMLGSVTLDVSGEVLGDEEYTTINGNMKALSKSMKREYTPVTQAGPQALDSLGLIAYYSAIPDRVWASGDRFTMMMEDYKFWDAKNRAVIEALKPIISLMSTGVSHAFLQLITGNQITDITADDIAAWAVIPFNFPDEAPYFTAPGFEGVEMRDFDAGALTGVGGYDAKMLSYDNAAMIAHIREFIYGQ